MFFDYLKVISSPLNRLVHVAVTKNAWWLLSLSIRLGAKAEDALFISAHQGRSSFVERLIGMGASVNSVVDGNTALIVSMYKAYIISADDARYGDSLHAGHIECAKQLLLAGAKPNTSVDGISPLALAIYTGDTSLVELALKMGAYPNTKILGSTYPILLAAYLGDLATLELLVVSGADPNVVDAAGNSLTALAASSPSKDALVGMFINQIAY